MRHAVIRCLAILMLGTLVAATPAMADAVNFGDSTSNLVFTGGATGTTLSFGSSNVTDSNSLHGATVSITGGPFTIGAAAGIAGATSSYLLNGTGTFQIFLNASNFLTATINLINIAQFGAIGGENINAQANLSGISVTGTNPLLTQFLGPPAGGTVVTTFQFLAFSLDQAKNLAPGATLSSSFSGTATPVPEPGSMLLFGSGLLGLASAVRRRLKI